MRVGIKLARAARVTLEESFLAARKVWADATAVRFADRFYNPVSELFRTFESAAESLTEAMEEAESQCRY